MAFRVLILGGTQEGRRCAQQLAGDARFAAMLSFAGRTQSLVDPGVPYRVGGFGGVEGLVAHLEREGYHALIDATHPFAAQMSRHADDAARRARLPLLRVECPAWSPGQGDRWTLVPDMAAAAAALGPSPRRVLLTIGRLELAAFQAAPQHDYLIRAVDPFEPPLPRARVVAERGPFDLESECRLLERERIELIVSKNAGTQATLAKLEAARRFALEVVMVARPELPSVPLVHTANEAVAWLTALAQPGTRRGV
jgi:precorrin-6A/cobalt-precorrin-6A reductase